MFRKYFPNFFSLIFISAILLLSSCEDSDVKDPAYLNYFPLETGFWIEYTCDSIVHLTSDDQLELDTAIIHYSFEVREEIGTTFIDGENQEAYLINRYRRENDTLPWSFMHVWTAKINPYSAQRVEDNIRFIRLKFPPSTTTTWNGNAYNYFPEEEYSYDDLYVSGQYGGIHFDSTLIVLQNDFISHINRIFKKEIYAANAGLVFKQLDSVNTLNTPNGTIILNGSEYTMQVKDYKH